jgi:CheY-like chemotaxis protein
MTGKIIQIVEDEGLIALHLTEILEKNGYRITDPVSSGEMALLALEKSPKPDLILMDIGLAGSLDGIETAKKIRQRYTLPIIFLTAYSDRSRIEEAKEISSSAYLTKPVSEEDLLAAIRDALGGRADR